MKKTVKLLSLIMAMIVMLGTFGVVAFADGEASTATITPDTSWYLKNSKTKTATLRDAADLAGLAKLVNDQEEFFLDWTIKLGADIVYNEGKASDWAAGTSTPANVWTPISDFFGTFDGQGYVISGLYFNDMTASGVGLFAGLDGVTVKNVSIVNSYFAAGKQIGAIAGVSKGVSNTVSNCYSDAIIYADVSSNNGYLGGILGRNMVSGTVVENCWFAGSVKAECDDNQNWATKIGGIVGQSEGDASSTIKNCLVTGKIEGQNQVGGILGVANETGEAGSIVENCLMLGEITVTRNNPSLFFGQFACVWKDGGKITLNKCYGLDTYTANVPGERFTGEKTKTIWNVNDTGVIVADTSVKVTSANITGDAAKTTLVGFDFDGVDTDGTEDIWLTVTDGTPVLKDLATIASTKASGQAEAPVDPSELEVESDEQPGGDEQSGGDNENDETKAPETDAPETEAPAEEKKGCGGTIAGMSVAAIAMIGAACGMIAKKKED